MHKKIRYTFIAFPLHFDTYYILNEDEKSVLRTLIRLGHKGWFYGDKKLAKTIGIGVYHLRRAKLRLHLFGLIKIQRRGLKQFVYCFQDEVQHWRPTEVVAYKLQTDHEKMGLGKLQFIKEPFKNNEHFDNYFCQTYPKFADGRKGRAKDHVETEIIEIDVPYRQPVSRFKAMAEGIDSVHPTKLLSDFFNYKSQIYKLKYSNYETEDPCELEYYQKLDQRADYLFKNPDEKLKLLLSDVLFKVQQHESDLNISNYLLAVYKTQIKSQNGGTDEN